MSLVLWIPVAVAVVAAIGLPLYFRKREKPDGEE